MSHKIDVIAGRKGSQTRTRKINKMLNQLDKAVADSRGDKENPSSPEKIRVSSSYLADKLNYSRATITRNGFPSFFNRYYESVTHQPKKGIIINIEKWVEERKEDREKLASKNQEEKG